MVTRLFLVCARTPLQLRRFRELIIAKAPEAIVLMELPSTLLFHWKQGVGPNEDELLTLGAGLGPDLHIFGIDPLLLVDGCSFDLASNELDLVHSLAMVRESAQALVRGTPPPISPRLVDRILDRINQVGLVGLHPIERKVLDRYAQQA